MELARPFKVGASEVFLSASVGVAVFPDDGATVDELLRKADTAMYGAKDAGRGQALFYSADMSSRVRHKLDTEAQLRHALEREEFRVAFQPQKCLRTHRIVAAEALLRWNHPGRGAVPPAEFIPIAEETGYITILGAWAMYHACAQLGRWRRAGVALDQVAVNVSVRQFRQAGFARQVEDCLARTGLPAQALLLELTESLFVHDLKSARQVIGELKEIGVAIAIDDFGTGYSSLGYLKQLSFDQVKIDRAFVKDLPDDRDGNAIVNAVVAMSHTLGKPVIAEGIETERQLAHLTSVGVDLGQGYLLGRPVFAEDFPLAQVSAAHVA
jgi:EAL domain-containing protein (putative c-di-GMP-specific phosphodiesterase class I)